jgi:lipopolysaccharide transport system ATP-binding protein
MKPIIRVENLSKQYRIGAAQAPYKTLRESLTEAVRAPFSRFRSDGSGADNTVWALKDVSFEVMPGEIVGIIGRNGAGKSTLLKILSRITEPTEGKVDLYGRVGSLLEVGTGFHPELTGRENIYLNGAILGMHRQDINRRLDEIVDFSELEKFLDTPVKHYSSGMYMKLAFAVAAHLEPDILLIDEVLAVGDYAFQQKCMNKAGGMAKSGRTVLLVSHNLSVLSDVSQHAIWIEKGTVKDTGLARDVVSQYIQAGVENSGQWKKETPEVPAIAYPVELSVYQKEKGVTGEVFIDQAFDIRLRYVLTKDMQFCRVGLLINNSFGVVVFSTAEPDDPSLSPINRKAGIYHVVCRVPSWLLAPDSYSITIHIDSDPLYRLCTEPSVCDFKVVENSLRGPAHYGRPGIVAPKLQWEMI